MNQFLAISFTVACCVVMVSCQMPGQAMSLSSPPSGFESLIQLSGSQSSSGRQALASAIPGMSMRRSSRTGLSGLMGGPNMAFMMGSGAEFNDIVRFSMCSNGGMPMLMCLQFLN